MSNHPKGPDGRDGDEPFEADKATIPPTGDNEEEDASTVVGSLDDLVAQSARNPTPVPARPVPPPSSSSPGGLKQMFSRDPSQVRDALPSPDEGDALLDMLFDDKDDSAETRVLDTPVTRETRTPGLALAR